MKVDSFDKHPEDRGLESKHQQHQKALHQKQNENSQLKAMKNTLVHMHIIQIVQEA